MKKTDSEQLLAHSPVLSVESASTAHSRYQEDQANQALMLAVGRGDRQAFEKLYTKFKGPIMSYVVSMVKSRSAAEELVQEIFLKIYRVREEYRPTAKFTTWFWTIARNTTLDLLRKKGEVLLEDLSPNDNTDADSLNSSIIDQIESPLSSAETQLIEGVENAKLQQCLQKLTPLQREATLLRTVSELSYDEIAVTIGTSLSSVKSLIHRSKTQLMDCMKKGAK